MTTRYRYLEGLPLESYEGVSPRILIGMNNCRLGHALKSVEGEENEPMACETRLGWIVYGLCTMESAVVNAKYSGHHSFHINLRVGEVMNPSLVLKRYTIEPPGTSGSYKLPTSKDEACTLQILSTETRVAGNHYESSLLTSEFPKVHNDERRSSKFDDLDSKWRLYSPTVPNFGGCSGCLEQSVKRTLNDLNTLRVPPDEFLRSMLMEIEIILNSRPLTDIPSDNDTEPPLIPNRFLLESSNGRKPPISLDDRPVVLKHSWTMAQLYTDIFWKKWLNEYLPTLTWKTKFQSIKSIEKGDLVLIVDCNLPRNYWPRGRVVDTVLAKHGQVRRVIVQTARGVLERPATKVVLRDVGAMEGKPQ
ncbi:uncharacterized protein LOC128740347 [Sabethes cyaneus]|uniref:uncharacterized protein LOC128740347 n=1 Tax=Sabethes cyaneus TaxID=53552 RepID=UPI00237D3740|nr:uncharacterized protein LOC128740347 [Sabethes cyaneus]